MRVREAARPILLATGIFWAGAVLGFFLTAQNPVLESFFVSPPMREAIAAKRLWTESLTRTAPAASSGIAVNNINVSLLTWGLGLTFGIGTVWLLVFNGMMLGAIAAACLRAGMLLPLTEFVVAHGSLELPAIWISGGAGLLMAQAMLFPGRYSRRVELRLKGRNSVQIMVGIVPLLLVAGAIEAFVSPSDISGVAKALLGLSLAVALLGYIVARALATEPAGNHFPGQATGRPVSGSKRMSIAPWQDRDERSVTSADFVATNPGGGWSDATAMPVVPGPSPDSGDSVMTSRPVSTFISGLVFAMAMAAPGSARCNSVSKTSHAFPIPYSASSTWATDPRLLRQSCLSVTGHSESWATMDPREIGALPSGGHGRSIGQRPRITRAQGRISRARWLLHRHGEPHWPRDSSDASARTTRMEPRPPDARNVPDRVR